MSNNHFDIAVIGGGAAGMMAAISAAMYGANVVILEKNHILGKKMRITGKGRCNITNACEDTVFFENIPVNSKFMYSAYYNFNNFALQKFLADNGLELKTERGGRVFPKSDKAIDVVNVFIKILQDLNVDVLFSRVRNIQKNSSGFFEISLVDNKITSVAVILATGGVSYPLTGSTGDGYKFAQKFGHHITDLKPSLVPIEISEQYCTELQGLSLKNVGIKVCDNEKCVYSDFGEMMFTHFGVTGPIVLSSSSHIKSDKNYKLYIDLKPALSAEMLDKRLLRDFSQFINKNFSNSLDLLLPKKLIPVIIELSGIHPDKKVNSITKAERENLVALMKGFPISVKGLRPIEEAIITSGGVQLQEVNPSTMESRLCNNLYFCGEVLDVDAYTGGFNLQIAFSTGYLAGEKAAQKCIGGF